MPPGQNLGRPGNELAYGTDYEVPLVSYFPPIGTIGNFFSSSQPETLVHVSRLWHLTLTP
jgi:hypothetical protein